MDEDRITFNEIDLAAAIRGLREALGRSQDVMAQMIGCSLATYQKWEMGSVVPGGEWLVRMLRLCPDEDTRNAFRIRAERRTGERPRLRAVAPGPLKPAERDEYRQVALQAIDTLYHCGAAGFRAADDRLSDFARNLDAAARYFITELAGIEQLK